MTNRIINLVAFTLLTFLWLAFGAALLFNREILDSAWQVFRDWPLTAQLITGLLALPVVLGLWVWEAPWPLVLRSVLVIGLAWASIYTFFPRNPGGQASAYPTKS